jgi:hypothetical protein
MNALASGVSYASAESHITEIASVLAAAYAIEGPAINQSCATIHDMITTIKLRGDSFILIDSDVWSLDTFSRLCDMFADRTLVYRSFLNKIRDSIVSSLRVYVDNPERLNDGQLSCLYLVFFPEGECLIDSFHERKRMISRRNSQAIDGRGLHVNWWFNEDTGI